MAPARGVLRQDDPERVAEADQVHGGHGAAAKGGRQRVPPAARLRLSLATVGTPTERRRRVSGIQWKLTSDQRSDRTFGTKYVERK